MDFKERKAKRTAHFINNVKGVKQKVCGVCNGSGYYDTNIFGRTPKCGCCNGTGKTPQPKLLINKHKKNEQNN